MFFFLVMAAVPAMANVTYSLTDLTGSQDNLYQITYFVTDFNATFYSGLDIYSGYGTYLPVYWAFAEKRFLHKIEG